MKFTVEDRMCLRKRRFASDIQAACGIGKMMAKYPDAAQQKWRYYQCPNCRGWHITKEPQDNPEYQKRRFMAGLPVRA